MQSQGELSGILGIEKANRGRLHICICGYLIYIDSEQRSALGKNGGGQEA